ncbi:MAG TPA: hypothetical protein VGQ89_02650 [Candidatus Limnocylindrales bacterium]|nr:hypothetical protein [Candidatus Limnocylindrales bacterium]
MRPGSIPEVASDGTLYVQFANGQNDAAWEVDEDLDNQIMVLKSTDGGATFGNPVPAVQLEDGASDTPYSVIRRQTVWGHQIRWTAIGNISVNPTNPARCVDRVRRPRHSQPERDARLLHDSVGWPVHRDRPELRPMQGGPR